MLGILKSLGMTARAAFREAGDHPVPGRPPRVPNRDRAFPILIWDFEHDEPFCTGCHACERACPVECMTVVDEGQPEVRRGREQAPQDHR